MNGQYRLYSLDFHLASGKSNVKAELAKSMGRCEASIWKLWARGLKELRKVAKKEEP